MLISALFSGAVAQLGERVNGIHEVVGSIPSSSTFEKIDLIYMGLGVYTPMA